MRRVSCSSSGERETDKWRLLWGGAAAAQPPRGTAGPSTLELVAQRVRIVAFPSLPPPRDGGRGTFVSPGVADGSAWLAAGLLLATLLLVLLPLAASALEHAGRAPQPQQQRWRLVTSHRLMHASVDAHATIAM